MFWGAGWKFNPGSYTAPPFMLVGDPWIYLRQKSETVASYLDL